MKPQTILLIVCLLFSFAGAAQDESYNFEFSCDTMFLSDSTFEKSEVYEAIMAFRERWNLKEAVLTFNKAHLDSMYSDFGEFTNVRIYLTLPSNQLELPGAILVPVLKSNCKHDIESCVLEARRLEKGGNFGPISGDLKEELANWRSLADTLSGLTPIYGFNFSWDHVMKACEEGSEKLGVVFGISDLDNNSEGKEIHIYLTDGIPKIDERLFLDYSMPCPKMCGQLYQAD